MGAGEPYDFSTTAGSSRAAGFVYGVRENMEPKFYGGNSWVF